MFIPYYIRKNALHFYFTETNTLHKGRPTLFDLHMWDFQHPHLPLETSTPSYTFRDFNALSYPNRLQRPVLPQQTSTPNSTPRDFKARCYPPKLQCPSTLSSTPCCPTPRLQRPLPVLPLWTSIPYSIPRETSTPNSTPTPCPTPRDLSALFNPTGIQRHSVD